MKLVLEYRKKGSSGKVNESKQKLKLVVNRFKLPLVFMAVGLLLMLMPSSSDTKPELDKTDAMIGKILSNAQGVGDCIVLISDKGVVIVCEGADKPKVKLEIIQAISSYTGYSSEKITILKMVD